ncbi:MAG: sugar phosphate isomerase/epimerase [Chloroflexi bacterium]|nr:MAG: sugar phosphate isomerase/epimerase [Chloroflexota bacterium]
MIAVQLYTLRTELQDPQRLGAVLQRLREIGYRSVEVAGLGPKAVGRFGEELKRADLVACAAHVALDRLAGDLDSVAAECREWGCEYVVIPSLPEDYRSEHGYLRFAAEAAELASRLRPSGLHLVYHNHSHELERFGQRTGLETLFATASPDVLQAELDTYWLQYGGANPADWIRSYKHRVPLVHVKDMAIDRGRPMDAEVGEGNLNWVEILSACRDAGTRWLVVEQDNPRRDPMQSVAISYANLVKLVERVGLEG